MVRDERMAEQERIRPRKRQTGQAKGDLELSAALGLRTRIQFCGKGGGCSGSSSSTSITSGGSSGNSGNSSGGNTTSNITGNSSGGGARGNSSTNKNISSDERGQRGRRQALVFRGGQSTG